MSQAKVSEWVSYLLPVLEQALKRMGLMPQTGWHYKEGMPQTGCLLVDVTERPVPRPVDNENQKEAYSGKKKAHTTKNLAICDTNGYILFVSDACEGAVHDKKIWDGVTFAFNGLNLLANLGFVGINKDTSNAILPYKKTKNKELTTLQQQINKAIGSMRITIAHAFSGVKMLKIVQNKIRLKSAHVRDCVMKVAVALHNLRTTYRALINNS